MRLDRGCGPCPLDAVQVFSADPAASQIWLPVTFAEASDRVIEALIRRSLHPLQNSVIFTRLRRPA